MENFYYADVHDVSKSQVTAERSFVTKVYGWMTAGLVVTALVSLYVALSPNLVKLIFGNKIMFFGLIILELLMVMALAGLISKMSAATASATFIAYSFVNGLTLAFVFLAYTKASIAGTFFITAGTFGIMCFYGFVTKKDLTSMGNILLMAVVGLVIAMLVNFFLKSTLFDFIISLIGVLVFTGLTAYDAQKIKNISRTAMDSESSRKASILGALALYLDFINLFLFMLRLIGNRR